MISKCALAWAVLAFVAIPSYGQLASWTFDSDLTASQGSQFDASVVGNYSIETDGNRQYLRLPESDGVLVVPQAAAALLDDGADFEVRLDFRYEAPVDHNVPRQLLVMRSAPCDNWIMRCYGTGVSSGFDSDSLRFGLNFADGLENQVPNHPASEYFDNLKDGGKGGAETDWHSLRYIVSPATGRWSLSVNGSLVNGHITEPGEAYQYDVAAIMGHVTSNPILIGGENPTEIPSGVRAIHIDNVAIYSPRFFDAAQLNAAFTELSDHVSGQATQTASRLEELFSLIRSDLPTIIDPVRDQVMGFLTAYESNRPPLFESEDRIRRTSMAFDSQIAYFLMDRIQSSDFVNDRVADHAHIKFEAREAFPGVVDPNQPRVQSAPVSWNGTYQLNPRILLTASEFVVRPSGFWAPAGELVTIEVPQSAVNSGVSIQVGAHYRIVTEDLGTQNRFHDIGTEFPIDRTTMQVANPFGGGIYLKVPNGTTLGTIDVTISGALPSAYYSHREGVKTNVADWQSVVATTSVPWVDLESDHFMTTISLDMVKGVDNPDEIMDRWDWMYREHQELAGRTEPNGRAEFYILDRQLVTPAFGAGYPVTIGPPDMDHSISTDFSHDEQWGTWNPMRVLTYRPHRTFLHEMGHNLLIPEFLYPDNVSFTSESSVHIWASKIYDTVYGMDRDEAFKNSAYQGMTMDLAAMDWMVTHNFRNDMPIGHDPTIDPAINDQLRYQHRGHGPIVDFAWLFGWDKLGETYGKMYDGSYPAPPEHSWSHVRTRDQLVAASSEVTGVDTSPFWYFWGWQPSPELMADLGNRFPQSPAIRERIEFYRSLVPADAAGFEQWIDRIVELNDGLQEQRWFTYRDPFESTIRGEMQAQFDRILSMKVDTEDALELPRETSLTAAFPNPFRTSLNVSFELATAGAVRLTVVDMLGREVAVLVDGDRPAGPFETRLDADGIAAGAYILKLRHDGGTTTRLITRVR